LTDEIDYEALVTQVKKDVGIRERSKPMDKVIQVKAVYTKAEKEKEKMIGVFSRYISNYDFFKYCDYYELDYVKTATEFAIGRKYRIEGCKVEYNFKAGRLMVMSLVRIGVGVVCPKIIKIIEADDVF